MALSSEYLDEVLGPQPAAKVTQRKRKTRRAAAGTRKRKKPSPDEMPTSFIPVPEPDTISLPVPDGAPLHVSESIEEKPAGEAEGSTVTSTVHTGGTDVSSLPERYGQMLVALKNGIELEYAQ